jgi:hypothetical protein
MSKVFDEFKKFFVAENFFEFFWNYNMFFIAEIPIMMGAT